MKQIKISIKLNFNPMSTKNSRLKSILFVFFILLSSMVFGQEKTPDTLIVNSKAGKIILISDSIAKFKTSNFQSIINKAIDLVKDSVIGNVNNSFKGKSVLPKDSIFYKVLKKKEIFLLQVKAGGAFAAGRFTPELGFGIDFAPQRQYFYWRKAKQPNYTFINLAISSYWFFEKPVNVQTQTFNNIFLEASFGNRINNKNATGVRLIDEFSFGAGYLIQQRGNYFKQNTTKLFLNFVPKNSFVSIKPELYLYDSYKVSYLGLSFRFITSASRLFNP
jgi:hypothetical protein